jgi:hypothetical protein
MVRPARLELATSWFVVVRRAVNRDRLMMMKISRSNDLWAGS